MPKTPPRSIPDRLTPSEPALEPLPIEEHPWIKSLHSLGTYYLRLLLCAGFETRRILGWSWRHLLAVPLFLVGLIVAFSVLPGELVRDELLTTLAFVFAPFGLFAVVAMVISTTRAPWLLDSQQRAAAKAELNTAQSQAREHADMVEPLRSKLATVEGENKSLTWRKVELERQVEGLKAAVAHSAKQIADLKQRPEITGGFHDLQNSYYFDERTDQEFPEPIGTQVVLSVWLRNNNLTPTTLHNFKLQWEALGKTWIAPYAEEVTTHEDRDIWPTHEIAERNKKMVNLSSHLGSKSFTKDVRVEGYLVFRLAGMGIHVEGLEVEDLPKQGWSITLTLYIEDAWGTEHVIRDPQFTFARPSLRLSERSRFQ